MAKVLVLLVLGLLAACSRPPPDGTPEGVVRLWLDRMEASAEDGHQMKEAYDLLGPHAKANLTERADRASRGQGRRYEPYEMLAEGRFGLRFRPRAMTSHIDGNDATVDVAGEGADEHATVHCVREGQVWRIEPDLPDVVIPTRHLDAGM